MPLPIVDLSAVDRHQAGPTAAVELVLQPAVDDLFSGREKKKFEIKRVRFKKCSLSVTVRSC